MYIQFYQQLRQFQKMTVRSIFASAKLYFFPDAQEYSKKFQQILQVFNAKRKNCWTS